MIRLRRIAIPEPVRSWLADRALQLQQILDQGLEPPDALLRSYRAHEVKAHLLSETFGKCVYCESMITHVYFGDVEHIKPKARFPREQLDFQNLTLACALCNGAKGDFWSDQTPLLNPFVDDPSTELLALGFMISRRPGPTTRGRLTVEQLELNRPALLERRRERVELLQDLADQFVNSEDGPLKDLLRRELQRHAADAGEYAMIVRAYLEAACKLVHAP